MIHNLMTEKEMLDRLEKGEHPLLVSLDKHRRVLSTPKWNPSPWAPPPTGGWTQEKLNNPDLPDAEDFYRGPTCACCTSYWCGERYDKDDPASLCPIDKAGCGCEDQDSLWFRAKLELENGSPGPKCQKMFNLIESLCREAGLLTT